MDKNGLAPQVTDLFSGLIDNNKAPTNGCKRRKKTARLSRSVMILNLLYQRTPYQLICFIRFEPVESWPKVKKNKWV